MSKYILSVIIPTYNRKEMLKSCLDSLFKQTYPEDKYEIIVVDDGSTDGTKELVKALQKDNYNLRYFKQKKMNMFPAWDYGVSKSSGEIIVFIDDDCLVSCDFLEKIVNCFEKYHYISACVGYEIPVFKNKVFEPLNNYYKLQYKRMPKQDIIYSQLTPKALLASNRCAIKKDIFINVGGFDSKFDNLTGGGDYDLGFKMLKKNYKICFTNKVFVYHWQRDTIGDLISRFYKCGFANSINFKGHFKHWFVMRLPFKRIIAFRYSPLTFHISIGHFVIFNFILILMFFYPVFAFLLLSVYLVLTFRKVKKLSLLWRLMLYEYLIDFGYFAGKVVGSITNRVCYL